MAKNGRQMVYFTSPKFDNFLNPTNGFWDTDNFMFEC